MTPEERVGQLFLVTFHGRAQPGDQVFDLITRYHVSGVILRASNDNFVDAPETLGAARDLIARLQSAAYGISAEAATPPSGEAESGSTYIPLLVGLSMDRDGKAVPEILDGLSEVPTEMAIGGTWSPELARRVGAQYGSELSTVGFNLLLGPSLDVIEAPQAGRSGDLGVLAFGGDPYWAGLLGRSFTEGVHQGSNGSMAVVAKHFPGLGGSDRPIVEEVATIRKSLDELEQVDLAPFFAVTSGLPGKDQEIADGLLTSHIRYQGLQGNIRATTRPVSLDSQALGEILGLQSLPAWREAGGVMVSDALGTRALRRFYDPSEQTFNVSLAAKDAFLAGNDLLMLEHVLSTGDSDEYASMAGAITGFVGRYQEDPTFAERVDGAVRRILALKLRLFNGGFPQGGVVPGNVADIAGGSELAFSVASQAASLISPSDPETLVPPTTGQRIVFFTDVRQVTQCEACTDRYWPGPQALEKAVLDLYGPGAAGQVGGWNLLSYTMADLARALGERPPAVVPLALAAPEDVTNALEAADWLVFSIQSTREGEFGSNALKLLLDQRPDLARSKRVVVFAEDVPYEMDATDISKLDAYYALYGASGSFVSLAARLLFQEVPSPGDLPVSVPGIGYDLISALSPDPAQKISLQAYSKASGTERVTPEAGFTRGDLVYVETSPILDHNGRAVPDGTPVEFLLSYQGESLTPIVEATTLAGVAQASIRLDRIALISVQARSDLARVSDTLQLDVREGQPAFVTVIIPSPAPTATVEATGTSAVTTATPGEAGGHGNPGAERTPLGAAGVVLALLVVGGMGALGYQAGRSLESRPGGSFRYALLASIGALAVYDYAALGLPGTGVFRAMGGLWWLAALMVVGGGAGVAVARSWQRKSPSG